MPIAATTIKPIERRDWWIALAICAIALIVRLLFVLARDDAQWPHSVLYEGDAPEWIRWAQALQSGAPYDLKLPMRSPGVAFPLYWLGAGDPARTSFVVYKILWCVMSALTCGLAYLGFVMVFSRRIALIAAGLSVFSFGQHVLATSLNNEVPYAMCLFAAIAVTLSLARQPRLLSTIILAILHAACMLLRAEHPLFVLAMTAWLGSHWWRCRISQPAPIPNPKSKILNPKYIRLAYLLLLGPVILCLPWSIRSSIALHRFNTWTPEVPNFDRANPPWTPQAQSFIQELPAFARDANFRFITHQAGQLGKREVTEEDARAILMQEFQYIPEPLPSWTLLSIKGPLDFALANNPDAAGGFAKHALIKAGDENPILRLARPDHLYLVNHGYRAGWQYMTSDFRGWLSNVGLKLRNFSDGFTCGYTASNLPMEPYGVRRPIDMVTPEANRYGLWKLLILAMIGWGVGLVLVQRAGGLWLVIIACKIIVTILFYGYARQAASVFPIAALLIALPVDGCAGWLARRSKSSNSLTMSIGVGVVTLLLLAEFRAFFQPHRESVAGSVAPSPPGCSWPFESNELLRIGPPAPAS